MGAADAAVEGVVLVGVLDRVGEIAGRRVVAIGDVRGRRLGGGRVGGHRRAERAVAETVPPAPARLTGAHVGREVVGGDPAPVVDEALDRVALRLGPQRLGRVAAGVEEEDRVVLLEVRGGEDARVLVRVLALAGAPGIPAISSQSSQSYEMLAASSASWIGPIPWAIVSTCRWATVPRVDQHVRLGLLGRGRRRPRQRPIRPRGEATRALAARLARAPNCIRLSSCHPLPTRPAFRYTECRLRSAIRPYHCLRPDAFAGCPTKAP